MIAMPLVVYPYSAVLTLPLLAYLAKQMDGRRWGAPEWLFVAGFVLLGTQQNAWVELISALTDKAQVIYLLNSLGTALLMVSCCLLASKLKSPGKENLRNPTVAASTAE
jgi:hypothetical protein